MERSPRVGDVNAEKATRFAEEPELTVITCLTFKNLDSCSSKDLLKRPVVNQPSSEASTMFFSSAESNNLPEGGTLLSPGMKGCCAKAIAANCSTKDAIFS